MVIKIVQGTPEKLFNEISSIVNDCFDGVWSSNDLQQLLKIPHENKTFMVAYDNSKPVGYAYVISDYDDVVDSKIATIQELGVIPEYRDSTIAEDFLENAIEFTKSSKSELLEQVVSTVDQWLIPSLVNKKLKPSEIKADREISSANEAKMILTNLKKNSKITVLMNQLFFEKNDDLETHIIDSECELDNLPRKDPIAFGSIISIDKTDELENILQELKAIGIEWDEIGITFDYVVKK